MNPLSFRSCAVTACLLIGFLAAACPPPAAGAADPHTYYVSPSPAGLPLCTQADPCTLQAAVDQAADGDLVYLKGGAYTTAAAEVLRLNKSITLSGGWSGAPIGRVILDPAAYPTFLDGQNARRVVLISGDVSPTLMGLTIRNGKATESSGGGIWINNDTGGDVTLENCILHDNLADHYGGGVYSKKGTLTVRNSLVYNNRATNGGGAFMVSIDATLTAEQSVFHNVLTADAAQYGTLVHADRGNVVLLRNNIYNFYDASSLIDVYPQAGNTLRMENNFISQIGGQLVYQSGANLLQMTIVHNTFADSDDNGIYSYGESSGQIINNIFTNLDGESLVLLDTSTVLVDHNLYWGNDTDPFTGTNPIMEDPLLAADYHLTQPSPAIDAGAATSVRLDYDGEKRPEGVPADIGADEWLLYFHLPLVMKP